MQEEENNSINDKKYDLITFGNINLILILNLEKKDIDDYKINKNILEDLDDLSFLEKNEKIWSKIELFSNNESLNSFIQMNKSKKEKSFITYIIFDEIKYNNINFDFNPILNSVLLSNGIILKSNKLFDCQFNIIFQLKYDEDENFISLSGEIQKKEEENTNSKSENKSSKNSIVKDKTTNGQENIEELEEEEDYDDLGYLDKVYEEVLNFELFKYIFVNLNEIISGNLNEINENQIYNLLRKLKEEINIKVIIFLSNKIQNSKKLFKFIQISDIHIIGNKNYLFEILKNKKIKEEKRLKKQREIIYRNLMTDNNKRNNLEEKKENQINSRNNNISILRRFKQADTQNKVRINLSFSPIKLKEINQLSNKSLNENYMFDYLRNIIFLKEKNCYINKDNKLGIYLDDFNKIIFVNYNKNNKKASINEYNLNLFPKYNVYNLKQINEIKNILKKNEYNYISMIISNILNEIINSKEKIDISNFYSISVASSYSIKRILIYKINNINIPTDKSFKSIQVDKSILKSYLDKFESEKKENGFNNNFAQANIKSQKNIIYKPLRDKYLRSYMQSPTHIDVLKSNDFINTRKKILTQRETNPNIYLNNEEIRSFIDFMNKKDINERNQDYMEEFMKRKKETKYYLTGVNKLKEYYCYLGKGIRNKLILPRIKNNIRVAFKNKPIIIEKNAFTNVGNKNNIDNLKENNYGLGVDSKNKKKDLQDVSLYKEIKFNNTPVK